MAQGENALFTFQKSHCQQCFQPRKLAEVIRSAWQQAAGALVGAPHLKLSVGAKRNWQEEQERLVGLLSPEATSRASLWYPQAFAGESTFHLVSAVHQEVKSKSQPMTSPFLLHTI